MKYEPKDIEKKWQDRWEEAKAFRAVEDPSKKKFYALVEFPYPSGEGLHVGHPRPYTALDIVARKRRMQGYSVLFPIGYDAFGLPTENYAIKHQIHPAKVTERNIARFRTQLKTLGYSFDWDREINTTDPDYYRWTQWIFLKLFERGLAYKKKMTVNFCTSCKVVLANEEVVGGVCERCHGEVIRKEKSQWMLKITDYADRLLDDLEGLDFIEKVKTQEINWIGRSYGAEVTFATDAGVDIRVYTTRPDTLFGATYMVISPEHELIDAQKDRLKNYDELLAYRAEAQKKSDFERTELVKEKTGVRLDGIEAINPVNGKHIPIFVSDYVLSTYGTGAIMAVPAHDTRDWEFAKKFGLPIVEVVAGGDVQNAAYTDTETGTIVNSGFLDGLSVADAKKKIIEWLTEKGVGVSKTNFKLRDWVFSRQRYWGEPIPLVNCPHCGWVPLPYDQLPLRLPEVEAYQPTDTGESPLAKCTDWVHTTCPKCGGPAERETDTMPNWAGSSWYFLRYCDPHNHQCLADSSKLNYWMPVDWYNGGMEHVTLHLLYSRFWAKFLYDLGILECKEPYLKRTAHGMILGEDGEKMSKSRGNVVNPDDVVKQYGTDTMRLYVMFIGDFEKAATWMPQSIRGCRRFVERFSGLDDILADKPQTPAYETKLHKLVKKVSEDIEAMKYNTAIAAMMAYLNDIYDRGFIRREELSCLTRLLCPFAPHVAEEMWERIGGKGFASLAEWPSYEEAKTVDATAELAVTVNGKVRGTIVVPVGIAKEELLAAAKADARVAAALEGKTIIKEIVVPGKIVNIVVK